jgi:hypothetical protein
MQMSELDRRFRQVAHLRALWRAFRDPQERREDERLSQPIVQSRPSPSHVQEPSAAYGIPAVRAAIRRWWCEGNYSAIVAFSEHLDLRLYEAEPLVRVYVEEARARLSKGRQG